MTRRRKNPRTLREDERALWEQVAAKARPLKPEQMREMLSHAGEAAAAFRAQTDSSAETGSGPAPIQPFTLTGRGGGQGGSSITYAPPPVSDGTVHMDRKAYKRMKAGKLQVEDRIDLHGLTLDRAHPALIGFISRAYRDQMRLVLVITGKGKDRDAGGPIPTRRGVLRHQVPDWLGMPPLSPMILQITEANRKHGGSGAYYVYLKRPR